MRFSKLADWLDWVESCHPAEIELGLSRVAEVAQRLAFDFGKAQIVTVAGTNGKGSCIKLMSELLLAQGAAVGAFSSPHFLHYNERIQFDGQPVDDAALVQAFAAVDAARGDGAEEISLTYFEFGVLVALQLFACRSLDVILLEVGLGGRLDAVNIIDADISIVTSIDIDHRDWLGDDRETIAREKAGIFRSQSLALCGDPEPPRSIADYATEIGCKLLQSGHEFQLLEKADGLCWSGYQCDDTLSLPRPLLPLPSLATALQAIELLGYKHSEQSLQAVSAIELTGRFQRIDYNGIELILDVAHNPAACEHLAQRLRDKPAAGKQLALLAMMADKDCEGALSALSGSFDGWFCGELKAVERALPASQMAEKLAAGGHSMISVSKNIRQAFARAMSLLAAGDRLVVFGSFFTVAEVLTIVQKRTKGEVVDGGE